MADPRVPVLLHVAATDAGQSADFAASGLMGAVFLVNRGANDVYMAFDAVPANTDGNGRVLLTAGRSFSLEDIKFTTVGFRCTALLTTQVDVIGVPRAGAGSAGYV